MKFKVSLLFLFLTIILIVMPGCWDMMDIEKKAFILALGVDTIEKDNNQEVTDPPLSPPHEIHITMEILTPRSLKMEKDRASMVLHQSASSPSEAIKLAQGQMSRYLSLVHLRSIIIGEEYARQGIKDLMDYLDRSPELADRFRIGFVQDARSEDMLSAPVLTGNSIAEILTKYGEKDLAYGFHRTLDFNEFYEYLKTTQGTAYASRYHLSPNKWISKIGGSVFKNWKLIGWLNPYEVRSANWITGKIDSAALPFKFGDIEATYNITAATSTIKPEVKNNTLRFQVKIKTNGYLSEIKNGPAGGINKKLLQDLEKSAAQRIHGEVQLAIKKAQEVFQADYLDFGPSLENSHPDLYHSLDWAETFPTIPIAVEVQAHIPRIGMSK